MHSSIETGQKKASAQSAQSARSDEPMHRSDRSTRPSTRRPRDGFRERRPDAASVVLAVGTAQAREEQDAPQQQAPPDVQTGQSAKACLRREVPTDHEARGQAQRRQLRRVATELRRDRDPEAEAKHAKHNRIRTQADHQSRMTSVRGKQNDLHAQSLEGTQVVLVSPANQPAQRRARAAELGEACGREHVGQHVNEQTACRNKGSREATPESHGVPWRAAHGVP